MTEPDPLNPDGPEKVLTHSSGCDQHPEYDPPLRVCTCGGSDYVSCLCNLSPREWLAYAKTNPRVDQGLTLPKGLQ
jgi:hypothetical protein